MNRYSWWKKDLEALRDRLLTEELEAKIHWETVLNNDAEIRSRRCLTVETLYLEGKFYPLEGHITLKGSKIDRYGGEKLIKIFKDEYKFPVPRDVPAGFALASAITLTGLYFTFR